MKTTRTRRARSLLAVPALAAAAALVLAGCGARAGDAAEPAESDAAASESCIDTSGDTIKLGFLNSLTGGMAISEKTVSNVLHMAADEINADGGILGKQIEYIQEDGATDWPTFAEKTEKLLTQDCVAAIFGGWTSSSRKAVKPVVEEHNGLFFYPVQYEGLEASPNIYYTGATTNQQIIPAMDYLAAQGVKTLFLAGSDYVFPRTANAIIKLYAAELGIEIVGEEYVPLDKDDWTTQVSKIVEADPDFVFNTINGSSNVGFVKAYYDAGLTPETTPIISVSIAEEEAPAMGHEVTGNYASWNYFQSLETPEQPGLHRALAGLPRQQRGDLRPDGGRVHLAVPLQGSGRGGRFVRGRRRERRRCGRRNHRRRAGGRRHAGRREPPHLQAGQHRQDQRRQPVRHRLVVRRLHRSRPVPRGVRLVPRRRPRCPGSRRGLIAHRDVGSRADRHGTPRTNRLQNSHRTESDSTWMHSYRRF